jgi:hypothetical protein
LLLNKPYARLYYASYVTQEDIKKAEWNYTLLYNQEDRNPLYTFCQDKLK